MNRLYYDPVNKVVVDPTGHGVEDTKAKKLRLPVDMARVDDWFASSGGKQCYRYWKFLARGYEPVDAQTRKAMIDGSKKWLPQMAANPKDKVALKASLALGVMGQDGWSGPFPADAQKKLDAFRDAFVKDMGQSMWDRVYAPHVPYGYR